MRPRGFWTQVQSSSQRIVSPTRTRLLQPTSVPRGIGGSSSGDSSDAPWRRSAPLAAVTVNQNDAIDHAAAPTTAVELLFPAAP